MTRGVSGVISPDLRHPVVRFGGRPFDFSRRVAVIGIVNRTPDSFYDRGATFGLARAVDAAKSVIDAGADWIDIGGVPFGPGDYVSPAEEIDRVLPVIEAVSAMSDVVISVDTTRSEVADAAFSAGANVINDTSGLYDADMAATVAKHAGGLVVVHSVSPPRVPVARAEFDDVVKEVRDFLLTRTAMAQAAGLAPEQLIIDPGHDLNKNTYHSLELTRRLGEITNLGYPVLVAVSNKDFIGETLDVPVTERVAGSIAVATTCVLLGARLLRVHNVAETVAAVRTTEAVLGWRSPRNVAHNMGKSGS
jgi:dihydropteroate synthase